VPGTPGRISSKVEPAIDNREELVRFQHPAPFIRGLRGIPLCPRQMLAQDGARIGSPKVFVGDWQRWLMHSPLKRDQAGSIPAGPPARAGFARVGAERHAPEFAGLADAAMHSPFKRDEAGSIPASRTKFTYEGASSNRIRTESSKL
jgi:hypothetical protein